MLSLKLANTYFIVVTRQVWVRQGEGELGLVVTSVDMVMFSMDPERVLVDGDIVRNKDWVGLV